MTCRGVAIVADAAGNVDISSYEPDFAHALAVDLVSHGGLAVSASAEPDEGNVEPVNEPDLIAKLSRNELFAYIKARGSARSLNIGLRNDELREIARGLPHQEP